MDDDNDDGFNSRFEKKNYDIVVVLMYDDNKCRKCDLIKKPAWKNEEEHSGKLT